MKRALAILAVCSLFGFAGLAQFSGEWSTTLNILPTLGLEESVLTLTYSVAGFEITGKSTFDPTFSEQEFSVSGSIGAFGGEGVLLFDPAAPAYGAAGIQAKLDFAGVGFTTTIVHVASGYAAIFEPFGIAFANYGLTAGMVYLTEVDSDTVDIEISFVDDCTGIVFYDATLTLEDIALCCGVTYDFELYFTKANGFEYAKFSLSDLFSLCCGISFDASVKFGVDYKQVSLNPSIDWAGECLELGLDIGWSDFTLTGIDIDYIGISCEYGDCLSFEAGTAFLREYDIEVEYVDEAGTVVQTASVTLFTRTAPSGWGLKDGIHFVYVGGAIDDAIWWMEYEYAKLSFCGPGCCGGEYTVDVSLYWAEFYDIWENGAPQVPPVQVFPTLFGLSRVVGSFEVPVMDNLTITMDLTHWLLTDVTELDIGWTFTF